MTDLVLPDTNIWLDIIRGRAVPGRGAHSALPSSAADASHLSRLVAEARAGVGLLHVVSLECRRNLNTAIAATEDEYKQTRKRLARLQVAALPSTALSMDQLLKNDKLVYTQLMAQAEPLDETEEDRMRADARYVTRQAPAHKGNPRTNDSRVVEAALRIARGRDDDTTWLITRNTTEFEENGVLHPDLAPDYAQAGLRHARNIKHYLGEKGFLAEP